MGLSWLAGDTAADDVIQTSSAVFCLSVSLIAGPVSLRLFLTSPAPFFRPLPSDIWLLSILFRVLSLALRHLDPSSLPYRISSRLSPLFLNLFLICLICAIYIRIMVRDQRDQPRPKPDACSHERTSYLECPRYRVIRMPPVAGKRT